MDSPAHSQWNSNTGRQGEKSSDSVTAVSASLTGMEVNRTSQYMSLNSSEDPKERSGRAGGINRKALLSFLAVFVLVIAVITLTVVFVVYSGKRCLLLTFFFHLSSFFLCISMGNMATGLLRA